MKLLLLLFLILPLHAEYERYYQNIFCNKLGGITEYHLWDKTRVDCVTQTYAIEVDFSKKWAESIGQSLYYAKTLNKKPAVALIVNLHKEKRYIRRFKKAAEGLDIKLFLIKKHR